MGFITELNRRQVFKVVIIYAAVAWSLTEVLAYLIEVFQLPHWSERLVAYAFLLGFPVAAVLAWKYDLHGGAEPLPSVRPVVASVAVVLLLAGGLVYLLPGKLVPVVVFAPPPNSLAVLPLANRSRDAADAYFGDALTDELINAFSRVPHLLITGRTSVDAVVKAGLDLKQIGRRLNVGHLLEGNVKVEGEHAQISVQLINAVDGFEVWSQVYDKALTDLPAVQRAIGRAIATSTAPELIAKSDVGRAFKAAGCEAIYPLYMRANYLRRYHRENNLEERTVERQRALALMQEATEISPGCALAWDGLAKSYQQLCYACVDRAEQQKLNVVVVPIAHKTIELNPDLPGPWLILSHYAESERRWIDAEDLMIKALARAPNDADILWGYAETIGGRGRVREALEVMLRAYQLDPVNGAVNWLLTLFALTANEPDLALKHARNTNELGVGFAWYSLSNAYLIKGQIQQALELYQPHFKAGHKKQTPAEATVSNYKWVPSWYRNCLLARIEPQQTAAARAAYRRAYAQLEDPEEMTRAASMNTWWIKTCAMFLGDVDWLVPKMLGEPPYEITTEDNLMVFWTSDSNWSRTGKAMRAHPLFHRFAAEVGLLEYWRHFGWPDACRPDGDGFVCE